MTLGNCRINVPVLFIERTGIPPIHRNSKPLANLDTPEAGRVIRALLVPDNTLGGGQTASFPWLLKQCYTVAVTRAQSLSETFLASM